MVTGEPWERLGIDVTGPHPTSAKGNCYILTVIDHFTKWVEILPCKPRKPVWSQNYWSTDLCVHGCPKQILTDQRPNFDSQLFQELCRLLAIDKILTTPYKPSTNGNIERFHSTMHPLIAKWVSEDQRDWDDKLPAVAFAYRTTVHEATGFTPYFLMHGRETRLPADLVYGDADAVSQPDVFDYPNRLGDTLREAFITARQNLERVARRRKAHYDLRARPATFQPGSWYGVWSLSACLAGTENGGHYTKGHFK